MVIPFSFSFLYIAISKLQKPLKPFSILFSLHTLSLSILLPPLCFSSARPGTFLNSLSFFCSSLGFKLHPRRFIFKLSCNGLPVVVFISEHRFFFFSYHHPIILNIIYACIMLCFNSILWTNRLYFSYGWWVVAVFPLTTFKVQKIVVVFFFWKSKGFLFPNYSVLIVFICFRYFIASYYLSCARLCCMLFLSPSLALSQTGSSLNTGTLSVYLPAVTFPFASQHSHVENCFVFGVSDHVLNSIFDQLCSSA